MIILVRHGEATHHTQQLTGGWTDSELTERGIWQLKRVGSALACDLEKRKPKLRILCSDLKRAVHSAELIADALGMNDVEPLACLREKNNGTAAGLTEIEAKKIYLPPARLNDIDHRNYPGGETRREFYHRTVNGLRAAADWGKENLIIVAHKGTLQNLIFAWIGLDIEEVNQLYFSVDILPASVSVLGINRWREHAIFCLNETSPLRNNPKESNSTVMPGYGLDKFKFGALDGLR